VTAKVGDTVAWADVPDGAMVRESDGRYQARLNRRGGTVFSPHWPLPQAWSGPHWWGPWLGAGFGHVTIIALNLTGTETAADLQRLAEVFDIRRRVVCRMWKMSSYGVFSVYMRPDGGDMGVDDICCVAERFKTQSRHASSGYEARDEVTERLHAAGFRAGMTAEDAARLLAGGTEP
jgi:hypothetical protein